MCIVYIINSQDARERPRDHVTEDDIQNDSQQKIRFCFDASDIFLNHHRRVSFYEIIADKRRRINLFFTITAFPASFHFRFVSMSAMKVRLTGLMFLSQLSLGEISMFSRYQ